MSNEVLFFLNLTIALQDYIKRGIEGLNQCFSDLTLPIHFYAWGECAVGDNQEIIIALVIERISCYGAKQ